MKTTQEEKTIIEPPHKSRFYIKTEEIKNGKGYWSYTKVTIFDKEQNDKQIGEYIRDYHSHTDATFFPFKNKDDEWFALYAESYHATYVMSLPDCKKIAECTSGRPESKFDTSGFCPVGYYVPFVSAWEMEWGKYEFPDKPEKEIMWSDPESEDEMDLPYDNISWHHLDIGFIYGCYWGGEYMIGMMDLSKIKTEGKVYIKFPFDPYRVPRKVNSFSDVIEMHVNDDPMPYGVSVNAEFYRFKKDTYDIMTKEEEKEMLAEWSKKAKEKQNVENN
jgi:hypothetical protein